MNEDISVRLAVVGGTEFRREVEGAGTEIQRLIAQTTGLAPVQSNAAASATAFTGALSQEREAFQRLLGTLDPATAALQRYERDLQEVTIAERLGVATRDEAARALALLKERYDASVAGLGRMAGASGTAVSGTRSMGMVATNAAFQVQDFVVQVSGGTSAIRALSMQLPQLLGGFGLIGAAAGAAVAIIGGLATAFLSSGEAAKKSKTAVDEFRSALATYSEQTKIAVGSTDDLIKKYGRFGEVIRENSAFLRQVALQNSFDALRQTIVPVEDDLRKVRDRAAELDVYMARLGEAREIGVPGLRGLETGLVAMRADLEEAASGLGVNVEQAIALSRAIGAVEEAARSGAGLGALATKASAALAIIESISATGAELPQPLRDAAVALGEIAAQAAEASAQGAQLNRSLIDNVKAFFDMVAAAPQSGWLAGAIGDASALAERLWSAAAGMAAARAAADTENSKRPPPPVFGFAKNQPQRESGGGSRGAGGSGGGGGSSDEAEARRLFDATRTDAERMAAELETINRLYSRGAIDAETFRRAQAAVREEFTDTGATIASMKDALRDGFGSLFESIIDGGKSALDVLGDVARRLASMALQASAFNLLAGVAPRVFGAGGALPLVRSADGNVFDGGRVIPFARGGVIDRPVTFPLRGATGLAGEAGPEAIMPLRRIGGRLGVDAAGMGGGQVIVQNIDQRSGGSPVQTETRRGPNGETYIINTIRDAEARGDMDKVRGQRFGSRVGKVMR